MEFDAFSQGVEPGGLRNRSEIGILICYILDNIDEPFLKDDLVEIIQDNGFANYFETANSLSELIRNGNIRWTDEAGTLLELTPNGRLISTQLHTALSLSLRQKAVAAAARLQQVRRIEHENPVTISKAEGGGYQVTLRITDGIRDLMALTFFVPDISEANAVKRNFHKNPERLYSIMLAAVIGEKSMIQTALEELKA